MGDLEAGEHLGGASITPTVGTTLGSRDSSDLWDIGESFWALFEH